MQESRGFCVAALVASLIMAGSQADAAISGNQGRQLAASCTSCHAANTDTSAIPSLAGLTDLQITEAMAAFRSGTREGPIMHIVASALSPEEIAAVAHYLSSPRAKEPTR